MTFEFHPFRPSAATPETSQGESTDYECVAPEMPLVMPELPFEFLTAHFKLLGQDSDAPVTTDEVTALLVHERDLLAHDELAFKAEAAVVLTRICELPGGGIDQLAAQEILQYALTKYPGLLDAVEALNAHAGEICREVIKCLRSRVSSPEALVTSVIDPTSGWEGGECFS